MMTELWDSFRALPLWVRVWLAVVLAPLNMATVLFVGQPGGGWIAALAVGGMALNLPVMLRDRGFSRAMAIPHIIGWTPLVILVALLLASDAPGLSPLYRGFLWLLLVVDLVSLGFDYRDAWLWWKGDRAVPRRHG